MECGICDMSLVADELDVIEKSGLGLLFDELIAGENSDCKYDRAYSAAAKEELSNSLHRGLLTGCTYICKSCVKQLPKREKTPSRQRKQQSPPPTQYPLILSPF